MVPEGRVKGVDLRYTLASGSRTDQVWVQECTRQVLETGSIYSQPVWNECVEEGRVGKFVTPALLGLHSASSLSYKGSGSTGHIHTFDRDCL